MDLMYFIKWIGCGAAIILVIIGIVVVLFIRADKKTEARIEQLKKKYPECSGCRHITGRDPEIVGYYRAFSCCDDCLRKTQEDFYDTAE